MTLCQIQKMRTHSQGGDLRLKGNQSNIYREIRFKNALLKNRLARKADICVKACIVDLFKSWSPG